ncbi:MAG: V-type proton ATPase subunit E [Synergistaceae bacterium]|jgi:V/A-type H+-transporting ATPase subunit E|nr:V-type proton ATPase subunit E [Synergistaceae bacterium]
MTKKGKTEEKSKKRESEQTLSVGGAAYDEKKKLAELQAMILQKGDLERTRILEEARLEADKWFAAQSAQLDAMARSIRADAEKRAREITARHMIEAEGARDRDRLRLQNELILEAMARFQKALVAFSERPDCEAILTGLAIEACSGLSGRGRVKMRLRAEDAAFGPTVAAAVNARFPDLGVAFDPTPAAISGGVFLYSDEGKWRVTADWKSRVEEMSDVVASAVLAEL